VKSQLLAETDISSTSAEIINIEFKEQGKAITITAKISEDTKQFSLLLDKEPFLAEEIKQSLATTTVLSSKEYEDQLYYLDSLGFINRKTNSTIEKINEQPLEPGKIYRLDVFQNYIFLTSEQGELYFLDLKTKQTEKLFDGTKNIKISPDKRKLAFYSDSEIKLFFLKESYDAPKGEKGQNVFLIRMSEKIEDMFWLNYSHLILISKNSVKAIEIDNRDRINMALLSDMSLFNAEEQKTSQAKFFYSFAAGKLFILSGSSLWSSEKLIP
jgi:hypothetical protein